MGVAIQMCRVVCTHEKCGDMNTAALHPLCAISPPTTVCHQPSNHCVPSALQPLCAISPPTTLCHQPSNHRVPSALQPLCAISPPTTVCHQPSNHCVPSALQPHSPLMTPLRWDNTGRSQVMDTWSCVHDVTVRSLAGPVGAMGGAG